MGNDLHQIRAYVADILKAARALLARIEQLQTPDAERCSDVRYVLDDVLRALNAHAAELSAHLERLGGQTLLDRAAPLAALKPASVTGKALRDICSALNLMQAGSLMLETDARALGYSSTAALAARHREEVLTLITRLREAMTIAA